MITSNINFNILASLEEDSSSSYDSSFKDIIMQNLNSSGTKDDSLSYSNIKGISLDQIEELFLKEEDKSMAKNLRLATLFTNDDILAQALFNTIKGQNFEISSSFLYDRYEDKHSFLSTNVDFEDLLHASIIYKKDTDNKKVTDQVSDDRLNEILTSIKSFNFLDTLIGTTKEKRDEKNEYSFLYNDYHMAYEELKYKYEDIKSENEAYLNSFLKN